MLAGLFCTLDEAKGVRENRGFLSAVKVTLT